MSKALLYSIRFEISSAGTLEYHNFKAPNTRGLVLLWLVL